MVRQVNDLLSDLPDIYYSGYVGNAQTEYAEVSLLRAVLKDSPIPSPHELNIDNAAYLNGVGDTIGELRRHILDLIRKGRPADGEKYLDVMDEFYTELMSIDYPDAITHGLRKKTDVARSLIERTRGDLTNALQVKDLKNAMEQFETRSNNEIRTTILKNDVQCVASLSCTATGNASVQVLHARERTPATRRKDQLKLLFFLFLLFRLEVQDASPEDPSQMVQA